MGIFNIPFFICLQIKHFSLFTDYIEQSCIDTESGLENIFCKGTDRKYFRLCGFMVFTENGSTLLAAV